MRIKQLTILHWLTLMLAALNGATAFSFFPEKVIADSHRGVVYPPNLAAIILIDSPEYEIYLASQEEKVILMCYELGPFTEKEYVSAVKHRLASRKINVYRKTDTEKEKIGYWVYLDPERSRALGRLKVEEVKLLGLTDVVLLTQNNPRYAISLGFFKDKEFASRRLLEAQSLGLDAKLDNRYKYQDYQWLSLQATNKTDLSQHEWSYLLHEYQNIELKTVNCQ